MFSARFLRSFGLLLFFFLSAFFLFRPLAAMDTPILSLQIADLEQVILSLDLGGDYGETRPQRVRIRLERNCDELGFEKVAQLRTKLSQVQFIDQVDFWESCVYVAKVSHRAQRRIYRASSNPVLADLGGESWILKKYPKNNGPYPTPVPLNNGLRECEGTYKSELLANVNAQRVSAGLSSLQGDYLLELAARIHSKKMAREQLMSHEDWLTHLFEVGFQGSHMGQNIGAYVPDAARLTALWMESAPHRSLILDIKNQLFGAACVIDSDGARWWTAYFASF